MNILRSMLSAACSVVLLCAQHAALGTPIQLISEASHVSVSPDRWYGVDGWVVDGKDWAGSLNFWFRRDVDAEEKPIGGTQPAFSSPLVLVGSTQSTPNVLSLDYAATDADPFSVTVDYELQGNPLGSGASDLYVSLTLRNDDAEDLIFHLFYYGDFDGANNGFNDIGQIVGGNKARVFDAAQLVVTDTGAVPLDYQVDYYNNIFEDQLSLGGPALLNHNPGPIGPTEVAYVFQWDLNVSAGGSVTIDVSHHINVIPEPNALLMFLFGALFLILRGRMNLRLYKTG